MKSTCINERPERELVLVLRKSYIDICEGDRCAAALLSQFEYWTNVRLAQVEQEEIKATQERFYSPNRTLWVYKSREDLASDLMGLYGVKSVGAALKVLKDLGFIRGRTNPNDPLKRTPQWELQIDAVNEALRKKFGRSAAGRMGPGSENTVEDVLHGLV